MWGQLLIFLTTVICLYLMARQISGKFQDIKIVTTLALSIWLLSQIIYTGEFNFYEENYHDFIYIIIISLIFTAELMLVRVMRPELFRYPYFLVYTPFLIPVSFLLIIHTFMIKDIVFMVTQGVALAVYLLFIFGKSELRFINRPSVTGFVLLLFAYVTYWFLQNYLPIPAILWQAMLAAGLYLVIYSLVKILKQQT